MGRLSKVDVGTFISDGNAYNLQLGYVPDYIKVINTTAADTEVYMLEYFYGMGDAKEIWHYIQDNDGGGDVTTPAKNSSGGYISAYSSVVVGDRKSVTFDYTGGASEDLITCTAGHGFSDGERIRFVESGGLATGVSELTTYYVINSTPTTFQISTASGGTAAEMTSDGTAPNYAFSLDNMGAASEDSISGITISGSFMDDSDVIYFMAIKGDRYMNLGDVA